MLSLPLSDVATAMCNAPAKETSSAAAREARTPPPATITGLCAVSSSWRRAFTPASSGSGRNGGTWAKCGYAEGMPQHVRNARGVVHGGVVLGHRLERRHVVHFLVHAAELGLRIAPARDGDDRRAREPCVPQAGREVERADHLRHADAGLAGGTRVAVGHVRRRLFAVAVDALDLGAPLHLHEGAAHDRRHHEDVGHAVALQHVRQNFGRESLHCISFSATASPQGDMISVQPILSPRLRSTPAGTANAYGKMPRRAVVVGMNSPSCLITSGGSARSAITLPSPLMSMRGRWKASSRLAPSSIRNEAICSTVPRILRPPDAPSAKRAPSGVSPTTGQ